MDAKFNAVPDGSCPIERKIVFPKLSYSILLFVFCVLGGTAVGLEAYVLLPVFFAPIVVVLIFVLPVSKVYPNRLFFLLGVLLLSAALLWPRYAYIRIGGLPGVTPTRVFLALSLFFGLLYLLRSPCFRRKLAIELSSSKLIVFPVFVFALFRFLSVAFADNPIGSLYGFLNEIVFFVLMTVFFVGAICEPKNVQKFIKILVCLTFFICLIGVFEYLLQRNVFVGILPITDEYAQEAMFSKIRDSGYRIQSTFDHPLTYAQFLVSIIPLLIAGFFRFNGVIFRCVALLTISFAIGSAWLTGSRSGVLLSFSSVISMGALAMAIQFFRRNIKLGTLIISVFGLSLAALIGMLLVDQVLLVLSGRSSAESSSTAARMLMFYRAIPLVLDSPLVGYGVNQAAGLIGFVGARGILTIDSLLLSLVVESGVVALVCYLLCITSAVFISIRSAVRDCDSNTVVHLAFATSLIVFLMTTVTLSLTGNLFFLAFLLASVVVLNKPVAIK